MDWLDFFFFKQIFWQYRYIVFLFFSFFQKKYIYIYIPKDNCSIMWFFMPLSSVALTLVMIKILYSVAILCIWEIMHVFSFSGLFEIWRFLLFTINYLTELLPICMFGILFINFFIFLFFFKGGSVIHFFHHRILIACL